MDQESLNRLSRIETIWTVVRAAVQGGRDGPADAVGEAQRAMLERYGGAAYRYLLGALRDPHAADELFQEFALRFVRGDFKNADPHRGRFRDFVKTALFHLIVDYPKRRRREVPLPPDVGTSAEPATSESDRAFLASWREELLERAWLALQALEQKTGSLFYTVLRFRAEHPELSGNDMAKQLSARVGRPLSPESVRQTLHRAREKFADLLLAEVGDSLDNRSTDALEQELLDLGLLSYCRSALERRAGRR